MNKILLIVLITLFSVNAETLFEVKDGDNTVLEVATDGLRIFNMGDTLMVISSSEIKAFIDESTKDKALSRSFSVTTSAASGKGQGDVVNIATDGLRVYSDNANLMDITSGNITAYIDTSYSFNVTSSDGGKLDTDVLEVTTDATKMREGTQGEQYTDFSPENIFLGLNAGIATSPSDDFGINNLFLGNLTGVANTTGHQNIFIGSETGHNNSNGMYNVFMGNKAGYNSNGSVNLFIGNDAGYENTSGSMNSYFGHSAGYNNQTGIYNTLIGYASAFLKTSGDQNVIVGPLAAYSNLSGEKNVMLGTGSGYYSTGSRNVFIGDMSGANESGSDKLYIANSDTLAPLIYGNFATGYLGINGLLSINNNNLTLSVSPGAGVDPINYIYQGVAGSSNVKDYAVAIYDPLWVSGSVWAVAYNTTSDKRFKKNIVPISNALSKISQIDGVYFEWNDNMLKVKNNEEPEIKRDPSKQIGFIAQDIEEVFPEMVSTDGSGYKSVDYSKMSAVLLEAVKEQQSQMDKQQEQINMLIKEIETMKNVLDK